MIRAKFNTEISECSTYIAKYLATTGITPNAFSVLMFCCFVVNAGLYFQHHNLIILGGVSSIIFLCDYLDGALARLTNQTSKFGAVLDATLDRCSEFVLLFSLGWVTDNIKICFLLFFFSVLSSYIKARACMELTSVTNTDWPDFMESDERLFLLCSIIIISGIWNVVPVLNIFVLPSGITILSVLMAMACLQRFFRAKKYLQHKL